jgi:hypothetical protein
MSIMMDIYLRLDVLDVTIIRWSVWKNCKSPTEGR